jgi:Uma2 family endonuclease
MVPLRRTRAEHLSVTEFLAWDSGDRSGRRWQLCDGVPLAMAPATEAHGAIRAELGALINNHLVGRSSRCRVISGPGVVPRIRAADNVRIPDLAVTCAPPASERLLPEPIVLIEILSPSNADETWANVWTYTTIPGVAEIVVISSTAVAAHLLFRAEDGSWPEQATEIGRADDLMLPSIGFRLPLIAAYRTTTLGAETG